MCKLQFSEFSYLYYFEITCINCPFTNISCSYSQCLTPNTCLPTHQHSPTSSHPPGQRITRALRSLVFASVMKQEIGFFDTNKTGELINRLSADTSLVSQSVTMNISDGLRSVVMAMAGVGMMVRVLLLLFRISLSAYELMYGKLFVLD